MKKPVRIECNRWFQKTFGNTYFSAYVIFDDGSKEQLIKFQYGYGNHCEHESINRLQGQGYSVEGVQVEVNDVSRKGDL